MKRSLMILIALFSLSSRAADDLSKAQKVQACEALRGVLPVQDDEIFRSRNYIPYCLAQMNFTVKEKKGAVLIIEAQGQSLEDMMTVCEVSLSESSTVQVEIPTPTCDFM